MYDALFVILILIFSWNNHGTGTYLFNCVERADISP